MAILKHIASKSSNYGAALEYLIFKHDEYRKTPILDKNGNRIMRDEFYLDGLNCEPYSFDAACQQLNREYQKNKNMGLFKKKNPQDAFDPDVFTITDTILDPPRFTFLPAIYQDATRRKWAVHQRGGEPKIFDYADVLQCEIAETGNPEDVPELSKRELAQQILINPAQATKNNAAKRNMCLGMGVIVVVQTGKDEISKLEIPVTAGEVKRDSGLYRSYRNVAEQIKEAFDAMRRPEQ